MSISTKTRYIIAVYLLGVILIAWPSLCLVLGRGFSRIEELQAERAVQRSLFALQAEADALGTICRDWAAWDDTYEFIVRQSPDYVASNLNQETLDSISVSLVLLVDREGKVVEAVGEPSLCAELRTQVGKHSPLLARCLRGGAAAGLLRLPGALLLVAARPILTSKGEGPARGLLLMGRPFKESDLNRIARISSNPLHHYRVDEPRLPSDFRRARQALEGTEISVAVQKEDLISGYALVPDIWGAPTLILRADVDRTVSRQGRTTLFWSVLVLLFVNLLLGISVDRLLHRTILHRLASLSGRLRTIAETKDASLRVAVEGRDELSRLGADIDTMLSALGEAQQSLAESEARLRTILEAVHTGFLIVDMETKLIVGANAAALRLLEGTRESVIGAPCHIICHDQAKDCPIVGGNQQVMNSERTLHTLQGKTLSVLKTVVPIILEGKRYLLESFVDITMQKRAEEAIRYQAQHDGLTDLPNRARFYESLREGLEVARREGSLAAVLFLDLDRFKAINDSLGHAVGDGLLQQVAQRLAETLRNRDQVARLGGDEFAALLTDLHSPEVAAVVANRLLQALTRPFFVAGYEIHISGSIGIALFPRDGEEVEALLQSADVALYQAKEQGRNTYRYYESWIKAGTRERLSLENDLHRALTRGELLLHYQPQVHVPTGQIVGMEALVRWQHPELGLLLPGTFIPIAEESGLIKGIGEWVLHQACLQSKSWQQAALPPTPIAVNLSPVQLQQDLVGCVRSALRGADLAPAQLQLEITESAVMRNVDYGVRVMSRLKEMGVGLCLDDFGVGYTSLVYLKQFPLDTLKIDRGFLAESGPGNTAITAAIMGVARGLGLGVIAEGVETMAQLRLLLGLGCETMQGFLLGRPVSAEQATALLREQQTARFASLLA